MAGCTLSMVVCFTALVIMTATSQVTGGQGSGPGAGPKTGDKSIIGPANGSTAERAAGSKAIPTAAATTGPEVAPTAQAPIRTQRTQPADGHRKPDAARNSSCDGGCPAYLDVQLRGGTVRGVSQDAVGVAGRFCYLAFSDIPYAAPPVGKARFRAPTPAEAWGSYESLKPASPCPQLSFPGQQPIGQEDCLYLNVYTKSVGKEPKAVMVYIHGGGFAFGSGMKKDLGPEFLVSNDILLVVFNYRLGALGFLNLDFDGIPGNAGLKDQVAALEWVRDNIASFGGDPKKVVVFGNSAGAASAHLLSLTARSRGLFRGALLQSGTALASWAYTEDHERRARRLAEILGAPLNASLAEMEAVLRTATAEDIVKASGTLVNTDAELSLSRSPPFVPSPERRTEASAASQPKLVEADPEYLMLAPSTESVPMVMGVSAVEGLFAYYFSGFAQLADSAAVADKHLDQLLPASLFPRKDTARFYNAPNVAENDTVARSVVVAAVRDAYVDGGHFSEEKKHKFLEYLGDIFTVNDVHRVMELHRSNGNSPVFLYTFNVLGKYNLGRLVLGIKEEGVTHTDELGYLFKVSIPGFDQNATSNDLSGRTVRLMSQMWTDFAKTLDPKGSGDVEWPAAYGPTTGPKPVLEIGANLRVDYLKYKEPWHDLYNLFRLKEAGRD